MIKPLKDYVLIEKEEESNERRTDSGLIVKQESKDREELFKGKVLNTGEGRVLNNGDVLKPPVNKDDDVLFKQFAGFKVEDNIWIIHSNDIIAAL